MAQISAKELSLISELLTLEENMIAKCKCLATETGDAMLKNRYEQMAQRHQRHFDELYANLK